MPDISDRATALDAPPPSSAPDLTGRHPDPQGGRVHTLNFKVNVYEAEALRDERRRMEKEINRRLSDSEFLRLRSINGGAKLIVKCPPPPVDNRRERRGSVPKPPTAAARPARTKE